VVANKAQRYRREIAANVTVLTRDEVNADLSLSLADSLRYTPGIDYEASGTRFGAEGINIRGIGGNRVAMLIDGIPLGDQFQVGNFSNATRDFIDSGLIQRAEVLHGPASALYGSAAIGGVLAVATPDPLDIAGTTGRGAALTTAWRGADNSRHGTGLFTIGDAGRGLLLAGSFRDGATVDSAALSDPIDRRDFQRRTALVKFVADDASGRSWRAGLIHQDAIVESDLTSMLGSGRFATTTALKGDDHHRLDLLYAELGFGEPGTLVDAGTLRGYYGVSRVDQHTTDERAVAARPVSIDRRFWYEQRFRGVELNLQKDLQSDRVTHRLVAGLEYRRTGTEELRDGTETGLSDGVSSKTILGEIFPLRDFPVTATDEWGAYLEDTLSFGDWSLILALRADRYELSPRPDTIFNEDNPALTPVSLTESDLSPKVGIVRRLNDSTDIYVQYAHGFRAPPFEDANIGLDVPLFNIRAIPNPDLRSETSQGFDAGLRWTGAESQAHVGIFHTRYRDFIETKVRLGPDPVSGRILFQSQNLSQASIEGIEAGARTQLAGRLRSFAVDGSFYAARGENRETNEALNSVGPAQAVLGFSWMQPDGRRQVRLKGTFTNRWTKLDETAGELFKPRGHALFDVLISQEVGEHAILRAGLLNLTDRKYWYWSGVRGLAPGDPLLPSLAQPGRSLTVAIEMNWQ
jgi:hemoglobin/transferrin/lactoferrin receptor protein